MSQSWKKLRIEECCLEVTSGGTPSRKRSDFYKNGVIPWVKTGELKDAKLYAENVKEWITEEAINQSSAKKFPANTILMAMYGDGKTIGSLGITQQISASNQACSALIVNPVIANSMFLFNAMKVHRYGLIKQAYGGAQRNLTATLIKNYKIDIPPLPIQKKIAGILSAYDDLIENNLKRIKLLEEMAQITYEEWFVRLRFPSHETTPINPETGLPEGWKKIKCFDAMEVLSGGTPKTNVDEYWNGDIPFYTPKDAVDCSYIFETQKNVTEFGVKKCNSKLYPKDTVFITARGTVGKVNLAGLPMAMNQSCYALKGKSDVTQYFLFCSIKAAIDAFKGASNGGVFNTIIVDTFRFLPFVMPTKTLIIKFHNNVKPMYQETANLIGQNQRLREARDILLPRLMTGMIDVEKYNPTDLLKDVA